MNPLSANQRPLSLTRLLATVALTATLAACSSVKLDDAAPVEDRNATAVSPIGSAGAAGQGSGGSGVDSRAVTGVQVQQMGADGQPVGVSRIVYFDYDSFVVKPEFQSVLETNARILNANRQRRVQLEGHTDERGGREYNLALGQKRAEAVKRALSLLGVTDAQLEAVSFGEEKPAVQGGDESALARNRRVEITYR
jgi:peptidoglycan-associated lipoprotein